jgi:peptidoglycan-associated lipoprotein
MKTLVRGLPLAVLALILVGCATPGEEKPEEPAVVEERGPEAGAVPGETGRPGAEATGVAGVSTFEGHPLDDPASPLSRRVIYFEFDSSEVKAEDRDTLAAHGAYLAAHPAARVTLEGHADERGSREYNIGLGDRRAQSVRRLLVFQGAASDQIETVSYGEERPATIGHDEEAWSLNRRVEIVYTVR